MSDSALRESQMGMARYLRDPEHNPAPLGVEARRLKIYQDLVYNNVEGFISGGFPVLRSLYAHADWHSMVRSFINGHRCHSPYFLQISEEFIQYLVNEHQPRDCDPPFVAELAHYERVELVLDVSEETHPDQKPVVDVLSTALRLSPLAQVFSYQYPVHRIGPPFCPQEPAEPTYLAVYRDREDSVQFMELNAATARLLALLAENTEATGFQVLEVLAGELAMPVDQLSEFGAQQLEGFLAAGVLITL